MKYIHTHFKLFLLFGVFAVFFYNCKKDEPYDPSKEMDEYFEGKVNGENFEPEGHFWSCQSLDGFHGQGLKLYVRNCDTDEILILGKYESAEVGVYTLDSVPYEERPYCRFADINYDFTNIEGESDVLSAHTMEEIRLEIIKVVELEGDVSYVEGRLDAVVSDSNIDTTIVISDVRFAYDFPI